MLQIVTTCGLLLALPSWLCHHHLCCTTCALVVHWLWLTQTAWLQASTASACCLQAQAPSRRHDTRLYSAPAFQTPSSLPQLCISEQLWLQGFSFQDDDADDHLNQQMTEQFNFGGGLFEKKIDSADPDADPDRHRSKKEVWHQLFAIRVLHCHVHGTQ